MPKIANPLIARQAKALVESAISDATSAVDGQGGAPEGEMNRPAKEENRELAIGKEILDLVWTVETFGEDDERAAGFVQKIKALAQELIELHSDVEGELGGEEGGEQNPEVHGQPRLESVPATPQGFALTPFTDSDWQAFSGAEKPDDATEPLIGEVSIDGLEGNVIVDRGGVQVHLLADGDTESYDLQVPFAQGKAIAQQVSRCTSQEDLKQLGFARI